MHYRHAYHAGNFADVFKHTLLVGLLQALARKEAPFAVLDTHAGQGIYPLGSPAASRTGEAADGILRLRDAKDAPEPVATYLRCVLDFNPPGPIKRYPGSPAIALALLRPGDRLIACERVPEVALELRAELRGQGRIAVHERDGYEAYALLPPPSRRGLILVDPPFERPDEFEAAAAFAERAASRFAHGIYAFWYPLKNRHHADRFVRRLGRLGRHALDARLDTDARAEGQLHACGLAVVNPPFGFETIARTALAWLTPRLAQGSKPTYTISTAHELAA